MTQDIEMKEQQPAHSNSLSTTAPSTFQNLKEIAALIEVGAYAREVRRIVRAIRWTIQLRRKLKASVLSAFLNYLLVPGSELHSRLYTYLPKEDDQDMELDTATSATQSLAKHHLPELEACSSASIARLKNLNRRTVDVLASRLYFYYSLSYELTSDLTEIRGKSSGSYFLAWNMKWV